MNESLNNINSLKQIDSFIIKFNGVNKLFVFRKCTHRTSLKDLCYVIYNTTLRYPAYVNKDYKKLSSIKHLLIDKLSFTDDYSKNNYIILQFSLDITNNDKLLIQEILDDLNAKELLLRM